jgi:exodeoxyribonuclease V beta subunit
VFHDPQDNDRALLDMCTERTAQHRGYALNEYLAEELRLLYVALTRAKHCCYFTWGSINQSATSALAWLLHRPNASGRPLTIDALRRHVNQLTEADIQSDLARLAVRTNGAVRIEPLPTGASEPYRLLSEDPPAQGARARRGDVSDQGGDCVGADRSGPCLGCNPSVCGGRCRLW